MTNITQEDIIELYKDNLLTLETVLEEKGKILDCLIYLGVGCMKILDEVHSEEDEEAM